MNNNKILITGVAGFIGRSLVEYIVDHNLDYDIYGVDIKQPVFNNPKYLDSLTFETLNICDGASVNAYFERHRFAGVIHLAAVSRVVDAELDKARCVEVNLHGTINVADAAAKNKDAWFIFGSSREVYGEQAILPVKETAVKQPINIYGLLKLNGENFVKNTIAKHVILRFSNVYGNTYDIDGRVIPAFVKHALNDEPLCLEGGEQIIDFTFIDDTVASIVKTAELLGSGQIASDEIHISAGYTNKITDVVLCLEKRLNKRLNVITRDKRSYDVVRFIGDTTHRVEVLGDVQFKTLEQGINIYLDRIAKK